MPVECKTRWSARPGGVQDLDLSVRSGAAIEGELQVLWEHGDRFFCRAWLLDANANRRTVLAVVPVAEHSAPATLDRLTHEYGLRDDREAADAVRPLVGPFSARLRHPPRRA